MPEPYVSPLDALRAKWDRLAAEDPLRHAHPASEGDEARFAASGEDWVATRVLGAGPDLLTVAPADATVLDVGCGPGRLTRPLAAAFGSVHGVDVSPRMIEVATTRLDGSGATLHEGDGITLRCVRRLQFDLIVSHATLSELEDARMVAYLLRQIATRLTAEGRCLLHLDGGLLDAAPDALLEHTGLDAVQHTRDEDGAWLWVRPAPRSS